MTPLEREQEAQIATLTKENEKLNSWCAGKHKKGFKTGGHDEPNRES